MAPRKRSTTRKTLRKKSVRGGRKSSVVSSAVKAFVKKSISTRIENKAIQYQFAYTFGNVIHDAVMNVTPLTPYTGYISIPAGTGQANRIGNIIKPKRAMLKYTITPNAYNVTTNNQPRPVAIQMFLGYVKNAPSLIPLAADFDNLFQFNNTDNPASGNLTDLQQQVNRDYWVVKKTWIHKLGYANYGGTGTVAGSQSYANNDYKLNIIKKINIMKFYPKTIQFNDATNQAQNKALMFWFQAVAADGSPLAGSQTPCSIYCQMDLDYEDA